VYLPNGKMLNEEIIRQGYGFAYTRYPFSLMEKFRKLEKKALEKGRGLWAE
jgi:endonuclease YncB( thermonuclease family)